MFRTTALLPVNGIFTNGRKNMTVSEIADIWAKDREGCTIQVMERENGKTVFVVGCGLGGYDREFIAHHDQNMRKLGRFVQYGEIQLDSEGKVVFKGQLKGREIPAAAPVLVYK